MRESGGVGRLIEFWKDPGFSFGKERIHKEDRAVIEAHGVLSVSAHSERLRAEQIRGIASPCLDGFHFHLAPVPYLGDLSSADIILLMINPGVGYADYGTDACPSFEKALQENLHRKRQQCLALDPKYWWSSWFVYYNRELQATLWHYAMTKNISYEKALDDLSRRFAILELVPYYSRNVDRIPHWYSRELPSAKAAKEAALELADKADEGEVTILQRWGVTRWGIGQHKNLITLEQRGTLSNYVIDAILERLVGAQGRPSGNPSC